MSRRHVKLAFTLLALPAISYASFIETTMGTAVVNDATAAYFNPAAMVLLKNAQIIPLVSAARYRTQFTGRATSVATNVTDTGAGSSTSNYYSPNVYLAMPYNDRLKLGFAVVSNFANRDPEQSSLLRYLQSNNQIQDYDVVPSIALKLNEYFSVGVGINYSYTTFHLRPIVGFPGTNIPDAEATNQSAGSGVGANAGFLLRPHAGTLIGFNYRSVTTYNQSGTSEFDGPPAIASNHYHFKLRTPAHSTLSLNQAINSTISFITTVRRIQWSIIKNLNVSGLATSAGTNSVITNASIPYHLHDTWLLTVGGNYRFKPDWIARVAVSYNQTPESGHYQLSTGNSYIIGGSLGWNVNKLMTVDGGYAHAFIQNQNIDINGNRFLINGTNRGARDVISLKLIFNIQ